MTPEYGAASQLEKIDMLDFADVVAINKFERRGAEDARRDVARQMVRNREAFGQSWETMPVFGTSAARFDDDGVTGLYQELRSQLREHGLADFEGRLPQVETKTSPTDQCPPRGRNAIWPRSPGCARATTPTHPPAQLARDPAPESVAAMPATTPEPRRAAPSENGRGGPSAHHRLERAQGAIHRRRAGVCRAAGDSHFDARR